MRHVFVYQKTSASISVSMSISSLTKLAIKIVNTTADPWLASVPKYVLKASHTASTSDVFCDLSQFSNLGQPRTDLYEYANSAHIGLGAP